jgi:hypothetical protein
MLAFPGVYCQPLISELQAWEAKNGMLSPFNATFTRVKSTGNPPVASGMLNTQLSTSALILESESKRSLLKFIEVVISQWQLPSLCDGP